MVVVFVLALLGGEILFINRYLVGAADDLSQLLLVFWHHYRVGVHDFQTLVLSVLITYFLVNFRILRA